MALTLDYLTHITHTLTFLSPLDRRRMKGESLIADDLEELGDVGGLMQEALFLSTRQAVLTISCGTCIELHGCPNNANART